MTPLPWDERSDTEIHDADAFQFFHGQVKRREHASDLMLLTFGQDDAEFKAIDDLHPFRTEALTVTLNASHELLSDTGRSLSGRLQWRS
jgi:hypothetical protein